MKKETGDHYSAKETKRRAAEAIRRMFGMPHRPQRELVGTPGTRGEAQRRRRAKARQKS